MFNSVDRCARIINICDESHQMDSLCFEQRTPCFSWVCAICWISLSIDCVQSLQYDVTNLTQRWWQLWIFTTRRRHFVAFITYLLSKLHYSYRARSRVSAWLLASIAVTKGHCHNISTGCPVQLEDVRSSTRTGVIEHIALISTFPFSVTIEYQALTRKIMKCLSTKERFSLC